MKKIMNMIVLILTIYMPMNISAAPKPPALENTTPTGFMNNPDQDTGWVRAQVVGGGCNGQGSCDSDLTPGSPYLFEYVPDREYVPQDNRISLNLADHGGDQTYVKREICTENGIAYAWSRGWWHHGATWTPHANGTWTGPTNPHWAFQHDDICRPFPTPIPSPTATPLPTVTPMPGALTVQVFACNQPFATRITRQDTGEGYGGVSTQTFMVPQGTLITIQASGYGDFDDTYAQGAAGQTIRIDMLRRPEAGPCGGPDPTPPPGATPTPAPPPPPPPCTPITEPGLQALSLNSPPTGSRENPASIEEGPATLELEATGHAAAQGTGTVFIALYDVSSGSRAELGLSTWSRTFVDESPIYHSYARGVQRGFSAISSSHGDGWHWSSGSVSLTTPDLQPGHIYEIHIRSIRGYGCASYDVSGFVEVQRADITIHTRNANLLGQDQGPRADQPVQVDGSSIGRTDEQGRTTYTLPSPASDTLTIAPTVSDGTFLWQVTGDCNVQNENLDAGSVVLEGSGGCDVIFHYIPMPQVNGRAFFRTIGGSSYQPLHSGRLTLTTGNGDALATTSIGGGGLTDLSFTAAQLRPIVGSTAWSLSYSPASSPGVVWTQTAPHAGSAGDSIPDDLAVTFTPGTSTDNRFFVERDPNVTTLIRLSGSVRLNTQEGGVNYGAYGTVRAWWSRYNSVQTSVAADGSWEIQIPRLGYTPTVRLEYTKNLPMAVYDHAEVGTIDGQAAGTATGANTLGSIEIGPNGTGINYNFVLSELPPPPPPPIASGELRLHIHGHLDPQNGVYTSEDQAVAWPHGETMDFAPAVELDPLPAPPTGYRYEQTIVAWSFDTSLGIKAKEQDALGRHGCRRGDAPLQTVGDTSRLPGCIYRYHDNPSAEQMSRQARIHWSMILPAGLPENVYSRHLQRFQSVDLQLSVLVETAVVNTVTGERWPNQQILDGSFKVSLVAPRTTK